MLLSAVHVNTIPLSAIVTVLLVVKPWVPMLITKTPVLGLYVVPFWAVYDPDAPPPAEIASVTPLEKVCVVFASPTNRDEIPNFLVDLSICAALWNVIAW